jgi:tRNA-specific 2-thiouridylase
MSGGVDSSVVAHMLKEQGHDVIGVRFTLWTDPLAPALSQVLPSKCCSTQNISRAAAVAKKLDIPLHILDLEKEFKETVVDPFLASHLKGLTPNPCIGCNRTIKFGKLLTMAKELGCDGLATGHYARTAFEAMADGSKRTLLLEAIDQSKDQSYYLYGLTQEQLASVFFPLGNMLKSQVYALAQHFQIPLPETYKESQDLCFFPEKTPKAFLRRYLGESLKPGDIVRRDGTILGTHIGLPLYTIGQRRGLGIGGLHIPLEVVEKNIESNQLIVSDKGSENSQSIKIHDLHFISWTPEDNTPNTFDYRVRSLSTRKSGILTKYNTTADFLFFSRSPRQAAGQSLVLYRGDEIVGGGVMQ